MTDKERIGRVAHHRQHPREVAAQELAAAATSRGALDAARRGELAAAELSRRPVSAPARRGAHPLVAWLLTGRGFTRLRVACDLLAVVAGCVVALLVVPVHDGAALLLLFPPLALLLLHSRGRYIRRPPRRRARRRRARLRRDLDQRDDDRDAAAAADVGRRRRRQLDDGVDVVAPRWPA